MQPDAARRAPGARGQSSAVDTATVELQPQTALICLLTDPAGLSTTINLFNGNSPFKQFRVRNANANEPFSIRKSIPTFAPVGAVTRDVSGEA